MMLTRKDFLWAIGGALLAMVLVATGWMVLIAPRYADAEAVSGQATAAERQRDALKRRLVELGRESSDIEEYRAQLVRARQALPSSPAISDFLLELQSAAAASTVSVNGLVVGTATSAGGQTLALPITVTAQGSATAVERFLDELQQKGPRAVLITAVNAVPGGTSGSLAGTVTMTISLQVFYTGS